MSTYAYVRMRIRVYAYIHMRIRVLGWCELRVYFGSDISELHCIIVTWGSRLVWWIVQSRLFFIVIATPHELELPWLVISFAPHSFFHWIIVWSVECVSCTNFISVLRFLPSEYCSSFFKIAYALNIEHINLRGIMCVYSKYRTAEATHEQNKRFWPTT